MRQHTVRRDLLYQVVLFSLLLNGCSRAPAFVILGSQFPAWMICGLTGILLMVFFRWLFLRLKIAIVFPILVYLSLAASCTFLLWLIFFA